MEFLVDVETNLGMRSYDPGRKLLIANTIRVAAGLKIVPRDPTKTPDEAYNDGPYRIEGDVLKSPLGAPFDTSTGHEVWRTQLPAGGQATRMTYMANGKQYVVIVAGGHDTLHTRAGDYVMSYALP